jgi:hypothetical protein
VLRNSLLSERFCLNYPKIISYPQITLRYSKHSTFIVPRRIIMYWYNDIVFSCGKVVNMGTLYGKLNIISSYICLLNINETKDHLFLAFEHKLQTKDKILI